MSPEVLGALAALAWPILAAAIVLPLLPTLIRVARSRAFSVKYGNMEISVQDASDQIRRQVEDLQNQVRVLEEGAAPLETAKTEEIQRREAPRPGSILWVDDNPQSNAYEIAKLQDDGWEVYTVKNTNTALSFLDAGSAPPTLIISDMGRREGLTYRRTAGLDLIRSVRGRGLQIPIYIYTSDKAVREHRREVLALGGNGITASPLELLALVDEGATRKPLRPMSTDR